MSGLISGPEIPDQGALGGSPNSHGLQTVPKVPGRRAGRPDLPRLERAGHGLSPATLPAWMARRQVMMLIFSQLKKPIKNRKKNGL